MNDTELREKLADLVEEHFPKGKCKERGQAMVLVAYAEMLFKSLLVSSQQQLLDELIEELPDITLQEVIDGKQFPTPEEYKKMVWIQSFYRNQIVSVLEKKRATLQGAEK